MFSDPEAVKRQVEQQIKEAEERANSANLLVDKLNSLELDVSSQGREVDVRVNAAGLLTGLYISDEAMQLEGEKLARILLGTYQEAQRQVALQAVELTEEGMGEDVAQQVRSDYESRYGALSDDEPGDEDSAAQEGPSWMR